MDILTKTPTVLDLNRDIIVTMESFAPITQSDVVSDDGSILDVCLIECDQISRNFTYYGFTNVMNSLNTDKRVQESVRNNVWFGESEHPKNEDGSKPTLKRFLTINRKYYSHRIDSYRAEGTIIRGIIQWVNNQYGNMYKDLVVNHNSNIAFSIRAYTPNHVKKQKGGVEYVEKLAPMIPITFDSTIIPGLENCRIVHPTKFSDNRRNIQVRSSETFEEICYKNVKDELRDALQSEESASLLSDAYGIDFSKADLGVDFHTNTISMTTEDGLEVHLPAVQTILSDLA